MLKNTVEKLIMLSKNIEKYCEGTKLKIDIYEAACIADMLGGIERAIEILDYNVRIFCKHNDITSFEVVNKMFDFFADEIIELRFKYEKLYKHNKKIYDCVREKDTLKKRMLFDYNGDKTIIDIVKKYCDIYFDSESMDFLSEIKFGYLESYCKDSQFFIIYFGK